MTAADLVLVTLWVGLTAYALTGGADFGGGWWDLLAGSPQRGHQQRALIEHTIGPVWEANHVWLVFVLVVLWTGFPVAFAAVMSTLYIPLTLAAFGVILRGSAFAFRKSVSEVALKRFFGATFAASSVLTPFFLGTVAGALASGRVPVGNAAGHPVSTWLNPTSILGGTLAVGVCAYLAAVYLCLDSRREEHDDLAETFRLRALVTAVAVGAVALAGIAVLHHDAPRLFHGLTHRALPLMLLSAVAGLASIELLLIRRYALARVAAALAVAAVLWGWGVGQYPYLVEPALRVADAASPASTLRPLLATTVVAAVLVVPPLAWLYALSQQKVTR